MRGGRREGSPRLAGAPGSGRARERRARRRGRENETQRGGLRGPAPRPPPPGANGPNGSPLLTHVATLQARAVPGRELRLDHLWGVPGQTGDRRRAGCAPAARPGAALLPSKRAGEPLGPNRATHHSGAPFPLPSAPSESQAPKMRPAPPPPPGARELSGEARGLEPGAGRPAPPAPSAAWEAP